VTPLMAAALAEMAREESRIKRGIVGIFVTLAWGIPLYLAVFYYLLMSSHFNTLLAFIVGTFVYQLARLFGPRCIRR
jgi:hypothetical protein